MNQKDFRQKMTAELKKINWSDMQRAMVEKNRIKQEYIEICRKNHWHVPESWAHRERSRWKNNAGTKRADKKKHKNKK